MSSDSLLRTLGGHLQAEDSEHGYLLLDPMLREPFEQHELQVDESEIFPIPIDLPQLSQDQWPRLIKLRPAAVEALSASVAGAVSEQSNADLEGAEGFAIGGWLRSAAEPRALVRHLQQLMRPYEPTVGRRYLRLADRRVLEWAWAGLQPLQHRQWLGPVSQWWTLNRRGELILHSAADDAQASADHEPRLTSAQWIRLHDCELAQQILRGWSSFAETLPTDYLQQVELALKAARSLGLTQPIEIVLMSAYQLQIHPQLCEHPRIVELARLASSNDVPLQDALAEIPDPEGWDRIRQELTTGSQIGAPAFN